MGFFVKLFKEDFGGLMWCNLFFGELFVNGFVVGRGWGVVGLVFWGLKMVCWEFLGWLDFKYSLNLYFKIILYFVHFKYIAMFVL